MPEGMFSSVIALKVEETRSACLSQSAASAWNAVKDDGVVSRAGVTINVFATAVLADLHEQLRAFYSESAGTRSIPSL